MRIGALRCVCLSSRASTCFMSASSRSTCAHAHACERYTLSANSGPASSPLPSNDGQVPRLLKAGPLRGVTVPTALHEGHVLPHSRMLSLCGAGQELIEGVQWRPLLAADYQIVDDKLELAGPGHLCMGQP